MCRRKNKNRRRRARRQAKRRLLQRKAIKIFFANFKFTLDAAQEVLKSAKLATLEASKAFEACAALMIPKLRVITSQINTDAEQAAVALGIVRERTFENVKIIGVKPCNLETK